MSMSYDAQPYGSNEHATVLYHGHAAPMYIKDGQP